MKRKTVSKKKSSAHKKSSAPSGQFKKLNVKYRNDKFTYSSYQKKTINVSDGEIQTDKMFSAMLKQIKKMKNYDALSFTLGSTINKRVRKKKFESINLGRSSGFIEKGTDNAFIKSKFSELFDIMSEFFESYNDDDGKLSSRLKFRVNFVKFRKDTVKPIQKKKKKKR